MQEQEQEQEKSESKEESRLIEQKSDEGVFLSMGVPQDIIKGLEFLREVSESYWEDKIENQIVEIDYKIVCYMLDYSEKRSPDSSPKGSPSSSETFHTGKWNKEFNIFTKNGSCLVVGGGGKESMASTKTTKTTKTTPLKKKRFTRRKKKSGKKKADMDAYKLRSSSGGATTDPSPPVN